MEEKCGRRKEKVVHRNGVGLESIMELNRFCIKWVWVSVYSFDYVLFINSKSYKYFVRYVAITSENACEMDE